MAVDGASVSIHTVGAESIRLLSDHGAVQRTVEGPTATFRIPEDLVHHDDHTYVRVECFGEGEAMAWAQPFWLGAREEGRNSREFRGRESAKLVSYQTSSHQIGCIVR